jgi:hypothetical protein
LPDLVKKEAAQSAFRMLDSYSQAAPRALKAYTLNSILVAECRDALKGLTTQATKKTKWLINLPIRAQKPVSMDLNLFSDTTVLFTR